MKSARTAGSWGCALPGGDDALLPPREIDDLTHKRTGTWKTCENTGTIRGCSIINMEFIGQTRPPPYAYAEIVLDGASTRLIHMIEIESIHLGQGTYPPRQARPRDLDHGRAHRLAARYRTV